MHVNTRFSCQNQWPKERSRIDIARHTDLSPPLPPSVFTGHSSIAEHARPGLARSGGAKGVDQPSTLFLPLVLLPWPFQGEKVDHPSGLILPLVLPGGGRERAGHSTTWPKEGAGSGSSWTAPSPLVNRFTDTSENITYPRTMNVVGNNSQYSNWIQWRVLVFSIVTCHVVQVVIAVHSVRSVHKTTSSGVLHFAIWYGYYFHNFKIQFPLTHYKINTSK